MNELMIDSEEVISLVEKSVDSDKAGWEPPINVAPIGWPKVVWRRSSTYPLVDIVCEPGMSVSTREREVNESNEKNKTIMNDFEKAFICPFEHYAKTPEDLDFRLNIRRKFLREIIGTFDLTEDTLATIKQVCALPRLPIVAQFDFETYIRNPYIDEKNIVGLLTNLTYVVSRDFVSLIADIEFLKPEFDNINELSPHVTKVNLATTIKGYLNNKPILTAVLCGVLKYKDTDVRTEEDILKKCDVSKNI